MNSANFLKQDRGATTIEWVALTAGLLVVGTAVVYAIETGLGEVSQNMTAVVQDTIQLPGSATEGPTLNTRVMTPEFEGISPDQNEAHGIEWAAPHVGQSLGSGQMTHWFAVGLTAAEVNEGRDRVATLSDDELLELVSSYAPYSGVLPGADELDRVLCDKYHIALNEAESRGLGDI